MKAGAAVLVKTPGLSPLKTRLAAAFGQVYAEQFYRKSCQAIEQVLDSLGNEVQAFWALAEVGVVHELWQRWPHLEQGSGELGSRLAKVYSNLLGTHEQAILLGADAPQLTPGLLAEAMRLGQDGSFVIGPAHDGGFYLFLGSQAIDARVWESVVYSRSDTLSQLEEQLRALAPIRYLPVLRDVDELEDLQALFDHWLHLPAESRLSGQEILFQWLVELGFPVAPSVKNC